MPRPWPTKRRRAERSLAVIGWLIGSAALLTGCTRSVQDLGLAQWGGDAARGPRSSGLVLHGDASGPLPGLGPRLEISAWMRLGTDLRADLRFEGPAGPRHEVLVWTPAAAVLFDRRRLRYTSLGESPGKLDTFGGAFHVGELWWLLVGGQERDLLPSVRWSRERGQWRGKAPEKGYRRPMGRDPAWVELIWRDRDGRTHALRAWRRQTRPLGPGLGTFAVQLDFEGTDLEGRVRLRFDEVTAVALGDSILEPLWEPPGG